MTYQGLEGMHVLTTADIPPQNCGTNIPTLRILLPRICEERTGKTLPPELVEIICNFSDPLDSRALTLVSKRCRTVTLQHYLAPHNLSLRTTSTPDIEGRLVLAETSGRDFQLAIRYVQRCERMKYPS